MKDEPNAPEAPAQLTRLLANLGLRHPQAHAVVETRQ